MPIAFDALTPLKRLRTSIVLTRAVGRAFGSGLLIAATCAACAGVIGLDDLHREGASPGAGGPPSNAPSGSSPGTASNASPGADPSGSPPPTSPGGPSSPASPTGSPDCPSKAGPPGLRVAASTGSFCIDTTEVTNDDYAAFLSSGALPPPSDVCDKNPSFVPAQAWPPAPSDGKLPVRWVDWCDASAYCAWAGKSLCGAEGGGALDIAGSPAAGRWFRACSGSAGSAYPYGSAYKAGTCNDGATNGSALVVASAAECVGGYPGLFDMSGNVAEWENACASNGEDSDLCSVRGGAFDTVSSSALACGARASLGRLATAANVGFRCCSQ